MNKRKLEIFVDTHLQLCEACVSDAGTIYRAIDLHRDDLRRWLPFVDGLHSVAEEKNFLSGLCAEVPELRNYTFKILFEGVFCGLVGFVFTDTVNRKTEIGYWLLPEFRWHHVSLCCEIVFMGVRCQDDEPRADKMCRRKSLFQCNTSSIGIPS